MKNIKRKTLLSIGSIVAVATPVFSVIACSSQVTIAPKVFKKGDGKRQIEFVSSRFSPMDWSIFGSKATENEPVMFRNIYYTSLQQGVSFIYNVARELGWNWDQNGISAKYFKNGTHPDIKTAINTEYEEKSNVSPDIADEFDDIIQEANKDEQGLHEIINESLLVEIDNVIPLLSKQVWANIQLVNASKQNPKFKTTDADPDSQKSAILTNYAFLNKKKRRALIFNALNKMNLFNLKSYSYNMLGMMLKNVAIQLNQLKDLSGKPTGNYKLVAWKYTDGFTNRISLGEGIKVSKSGLEMAKKIKEKIGTFDSSKTMKILGNTWLDPLSDDGSMKPSMFNTFGMDSKDIMKSNLPLGRYTSYDNVQMQIYRYSSFIDGRNPGRLLWKMYANNLGGKYVFPSFKFPSNFEPFSLPTISTKDNFYQTFYVIKNEEKIKEISELLYSSLVNLKENIEKIPEWQAKLLRSFASPLFIDFKDWIKYTDITSDRILKIVRKLNNGSHYMLGVEVFMRGIKNIPLAFRPSSKAVDPVNTQEVVGMANSTSIYSSILNYSVDTRGGEKENGYKVYPYKGLKASIKNFPFNPRVPSVKYKKMSKDYTVEEMLKFDGNKDHKILTGAEMKIYSGKATKAILKVENKGRPEDIILRP